MVSNYDETLAVNILERDRNLAYNSTTQTRNTLYDTADNTKLTAQRIQQRDTQITKAGHVQTYQQSIATATETNTITPDENVLTTTNESAAEIYRRDIVSLRDTNNTSDATINNNFTAAYSGTFNIDGTLNITGTILETELNDLTTQQNFNVDATTQRAASETARTDITRNYEVDFLTNYASTLDNTSGNPFENFNFNRQNATTSRVTTFADARQTLLYIETDANKESVITLGELGKNAEEAVRRADAQNNITGSNSFVDLMADHQTTNADNPEGREETNEELPSLENILSQTEYTASEDAGEESAQDTTDENNNETTSEIGVRKNRNVKELDRDKLIDWMIKNSRPNTSEPTANDSEFLPRRFPRLKPNGVCVNCHPLKPLYIPDGASDRLLERITEDIQETGQDIASVITPIASAGYNYLAGVVYGFAIDGFVGTVEGIGSIAKFAWKNKSKAAYLLIPALGAFKAGKIVAEYDSGRRNLEADIQAIKKRVDYVKKQSQEALAIGAELEMLYKNDKVTLNKLIAGVTDGLEDKVSPELILLMDIAGDAFDKVQKVIDDALKDITVDDVAYLYGRIVGMILYEIAETALLNYAAGAKAGKIPIWINTLKKWLPDVNVPALKAIWKNVAFRAKTLLGKKMCFVAGTKIHTANGLKNIEKIVAGDLVLTRPEDADASFVERVYKPVVQTFVTHPDELFFDVTYRTEDDIEETLTATGGHPFYVVGKNEFVFVSQLATGDVLSLPEGHTATVVETVFQSAPVGETFTTYNFEVAEHHTYFAGVAGVWVHNAGLLCDAMYNLYQKYKQSGLDDAEALAKLEAIIAKRVKDGRLTRSEATKHLDDLADAIGSVVIRAG